MNDTIEKYLKEIKNSTNLLLAKYKNLIVIYEKIIELYENLIKEYEKDILASTTTSNIVCAGVIATTELDVENIWTLDTLDGTRIYTSEPQHIGNRFMLNLSTLGIEIWTSFKLSAIVAGRGTVTSEVIMQYYPNTMHEGRFYLTEVDENITIMDY